MDVRTEYIDLSVKDGSGMRAFVARPNGGSNHPAIAVFQEAYGVNAHIRDVAQRFAALGMVAVAPELFHRTGPGFEGSYDDFPSVRQHTSALTREGLEADIDATFAWILDEPSIDPNELAAIGFCLGGRVTYLANARQPLRAAVSFYAGGMTGDILELAPAQRAPILMFWGGLDAHIPPEHRRGVADALQAANVAQEQVVFGQADHGFFCDQRSSYNPIAARQAWVLLQEFFSAYGVLH